MTPHRWHDDREQRLGVYAVDAVDAEERHAADCHLGRCRSCAAEVSGYREVAALLTVGGPPPCSGWRRVVAVLEEPPPPLELAPVASLSSRTTTVRVLTAVLAMAAAAVALLGVRVLDQDRRLDRMQTTIADAGLRRSAVAALADPASDPLALTSPDSPAVAQAAILPDGRGYLVADPLPRLAPDRTYQLWMLIDQSGSPPGSSGADR